MVKPVVGASGLVLAVIGVLALLRVNNVFGDGLYHGSAVNDAVEERQDRWWQEAQERVQNPRTLASRPSLPAIAPRVILRGNSEDKEVALTFDDGPHPGKVEELLGLLKQLDVKATFFVVGKMVEKHPELIKMEMAAGDEVENHSFSHVDLSKIPENEVEIEYRACQDLIKSITNYTPRFCRPPGGQATPEVMRAAAKCGMITVMWSDDPLDYANPGSAVIEERLFAKVSNGGVLLLHEGVDETMQVLPQIVNTLRNKGYHFVTIAQLAEHLKDKRVEI